jgi:hypothetical protein
MEPDATEFLVKIIKSISMTLLWMLVNMTFGIYFDFGFIHSTISLGNISFYIFFVGSFIALLWYLLSVWNTRYKENNSGKV